eukprot:GILI01003161.1.p1 GENE.GILI01003161.1~~GILI01003161.1.p1  ORF type:complete len:247 (+),score=73.07 GILI01003161.1:69-743(+)
MAYQSTQPLVAGNMVIDGHRNAKYIPGQLIHTVNLDQQALECLFCTATCPCCCYKEVLARATYMDVYTNGVIIGKPRFCCCFGANSETSIGIFHHFDDFVVFNDNVVKGELCAPFPFCCVDRFGLCGEAIVMRGRCLTGTSFFGMANECNTPSLLPCVTCCCPISVMYGLVPGEADRVSQVINQAVTEFKNGNWAREPRVAVSMGGAPTPMMQQQNNFTPVAKY